MTAKSVMMRPQGLCSHLPPCYATGLTLSSTYFLTQFLLRCDG